MKSLLSLLFLVTFAANSYEQTLKMHVIAKDDQEISFDIDQIDKITFSTETTEIAARFAVQPQLIYAAYTVSELDSLKIVRQGDVVLIHVWVLESLTGVDCTSVARVIGCFL